MIALPRRTITLADAEAMAREMTPLLRLDYGDPNAAIRPWQAAALEEASEVRGGVFGYPVGTGKTLLDWLLCYVLGAKRALLCTTAGLIEDMNTAFRTFTRTWVSPIPPPRLVAYNTLTHVENVDLLERMRPDLIILDEADVLRNADASAVNRIARYVECDAPMVVAMTGTLGRMSILDYHHLLVWALKDGAPVPLDRDEAKTWAAAIDEKTPRTGIRPGVGALASLGGGPTVEGARRAYRDRLLATPGVICVDADSCDQPLAINVRIAPPDPVLDEKFRIFREDWITPDGWDLDDAFSVYRHAGELGTGMFLRWDPRPPEWWIGPRRTYCKFVRKAIERSRYTADPLDTELAVRRRHPDHDIVQDWMAVKRRFEPNSVPVWISASVLNYARDWALQGPGLIWCGNTAFGEALSGLTGIRFYGAQGKAVDGSSISRADPRLPAIVSVMANLRGRNLQGWNRNLIINPPQSARYLEQLIGRTHRAGQTRPVSVDVLATSGDVLDAFGRALDEATFGRDTTGLSQKILRARIAYDTVPLNQASIFRWATKRGISE